MTSVAGDALEQFERERARLLGLAYRLLGSIADAEDVVQEAWLRWERADHDAIERPAAWLTTVTSRLGLDRLRARRRERVDYVGPWLPEPIVAPADADDPARAVELADSLTTAFLLVLEELEPVERLVLLLADVYELPFAQVADISGKSEAACRQIAVRARRTLRAAEPLTAPAGEDAARVAAEFAVAALSGDVTRLLSLFDPDVVLVSDGGATRHAARRPVVGAARVGRFLVNVAARLPADATFEAVVAGGRPAFLVRVEGRVDVLQWITVRDGRIARIDVLVNPVKLDAVERGRTLTIA
jgi:RNA polymerase sigma-70 factor (ECF subfamily)